MSQSIVTTMPNRGQVKPLNKCETLAEAFGTDEFMKRIRQSVPKHISPDRMLRTFIQAVSKSPDLMKCDMKSVLGAMLSCSQLGFEPNTPLGHAYLIPFKNNNFWNAQTRKKETRYEVQLILGYSGLLDLSYRSGQLVSIHADVAWEAELKSGDFDFSYGTNAFLKHRPRGIRADDEHPAYVYMHARLKAGEGFEVLPWAEIERIRNSSSGYRSALYFKEEAAKKGQNPPKSWTEAPWVKHENAMAKKTAVRAGSKWLPRSIEMASAVRMDELQDGHTIDFGAALEAPMLENGSDYVSAALETAETGEDPGAAFGMREQPQEAGQAQPLQQQPKERKPRPEPQPQQQQREAPRASQQAAGPAQAARQAPAIDHHLVDEYGEPTTERPFTDPVAYAEALVNLWMTSSNREAVLENNADGMSDAYSASDAAGEIIEQMTLHGAQDQPQTVQAPSMPVVVLTNDRDGKPAWNAFVNAMKTVAADLPGPILEPFLVEHYAVIQGAPPTPRMFVVKALAARFQALKMTPPVSLAELMAARPMTAAAQQTSSPSDPAPSTAAPAPDQVDEVIARARLFLGDIPHKPRAAAMELNKSPIWAETMKALAERDPVLRNELAKAMMNNITGQGGNSEPPSGHPVNEAG